MAVRAHTALGVEGIDRGFIMNASTTTNTIIAQATAEGISIANAAREVYAPTKRQVAALITAQELQAHEQSHFARMAKDKNIRMAEQYLTVRAQVAKTCQGAIESGSHQGLVRGIALALGVNMPEDNKLVTCKVWIDGLNHWAQSAKTEKSIEMRVSLLERFDVSAYLNAFAQLRTMADQKVTAKVATAKVATAPAVTA